MNTLLRALLICLLTMSVASCSKTSTKYSDDEAKTLIDKYQKAGSLTSEEYDQAIDMLIDAAQRKHALFTDYKNVLEKYAITEGELNTEFEGLYGLEAVLSRAINNKLLSYDRQTRLNDYLKEHDEHVKEMKKKYGDFYSAPSGSSIDALIAKYEQYMGDLISMLGTSTGDTSADIEAFYAKHPDFDDVYGRILDEYEAGNLTQAQMSRIEKIQRRFAEAYGLNDSSYDGYDYDDDTGEEEVIAEESLDDDNSTTDFDQSDLYDLYLDIAEAFTDDLLDFYYKYANAGQNISQEEYEADLQRLNNKYSSIDEIITVLEDAYNSGKLSASQMARVQSIQDRMPQ